MAGEVAREETNPKTWAGIGGPGRHLRQAALVTAQQVAGLPVWAQQAGLCAGPQSRSATCHGTPRLSLPLHPGEHTSCWPLHLFSGEILTHESLPIWWSGERGSKDSEGEKAVWRNGAAKHSGCRRGTCIGGGSGLAFQGLTDPRQSCAGP